MAAIGSPVFSADLIVGLGGSKDQRTQRMVFVLNNLIRFWGREPMAYLEEIIRMVKSRTDAVALEKNSGAQKDAERIKALEEENKKLSERNKVLFEDNVKLTTKYTGAAAKLEKLNNTLLDLQTKYTELKKQKGGSDLRPIFKSYMRRGMELDRLKHDSERHAIWYNEKIRGFALEKSELADKLGLQIRATADTEFAKKENELKAQMEQQTQHILASLSPFSQDKPVMCPVPTRGGKLVSLKHVYASWKKSTTVLGVEGLPPFIVPNSTDTLADPNQISLIRAILKDVTHIDPPFKIQFKKDGGEWCDVEFTDQIRIAAVMFYMQKNNVKLPEHRLLHNNQLLIMISFEHSVFKFEIKEIIGESIQIIESQLIVLDGSFEIV